MTDHAEIIHTTPKEAMAAYRRVLRMVDRFLRFQKQDLLVTEGSGLMTWREVRHHIKEALRIKADV